jgi:hypothetical protein
MTDTLVVTLLTAHRLEYALETTRSTAQNLVHDGPVHFHIADDGDDDVYIGTLSDMWRKVRGNREGITASNAGGRGYGASMNLSQQTTHHIGPWMMPLEDDWRLRRTLDTAPIIKMLERKGHQTREEWAWAVDAPPWFEARSVRLGYLGFQWPVTLHLFKTDEHLWAAFDPDSPEQHLASGHPRLETTAYQRAVGPWPEGYDPGATELGWCQTAEARRGVVWPLTLVSLTGSISGDLFEHIGAVRSY